MKKLLFPLLVIILFSCESMEKDKSLLPLSSGKYGEVLIVVDTVFENAKTGKAIEKIFFQAVDGLPQQEYQFRASTVPPKGFKSILKQSRNILKLNIKKGLKTDIKIVKNVWAKNQLMIQISAANDSDAARILTKNKQTIRNYFNEEEVSRLQGYYKKNNQGKLSETLKKSFGIEMTIPKGFVKMEEKNNGVWFKLEKTIGQHQIIQGIVVYTTPYDSDSVFTNEYFIKNRDIFSSEFIQGSRDNSFMVVYSELKPIQKEINLNGLYTIEYRGLWNMKNDFMGGPYIHYTFVDEANSRVVNLDGFVYAPKFDKREYLREVEALLKTAKLSL
jgi:hypothetical protein